MKQRAITFAFAACLFSSLAFAEDTWTLDSSTSNARLYQGSKANPDSVNTGVARVTGKVKLDTNDPEESIFDLRTSNKTPFSISEVSDTRCPSARMLSL